MNNVAVQWVCPALRRKVDPRMDTASKCAGRNRPWSSRGSIISLVTHTEVRANQNQMPSQRHDGGDGDTRAVTAVSRLQAA